MSFEIDHYKNYEQLISRLKCIVQNSQQRIISDIPDSLLHDNVNFFTKAYLISLCTYLEAFLQDVAWSYVTLIKKRISEAKIPSNAVRWCLVKEVKEKDWMFEPLSLSLCRKDLADELSGNPGKTIALYRKIGIDLQSNSEFCACKDIIARTVQKRNNIIHHNDDAVDISMMDLLTYADDFLKYMYAIECAVCGSVDEQ